jgi:protein gp37
VAVGGLILTKRPGRIISHLPADWGEGYPNVWLGVTAACAESMIQIDKLRAVKAVCRFVSAEPTAMIPGPQNPCECLRSGIQDRLRTSASVFAS